MAHTGKNKEGLVLSFNTGFIPPVIEISIYKDPWNTAEKCRQKEMATYHKFYYSIFFCKYTLYITWMFS